VDVEEGKRSLQEDPVTQTPFDPLALWRDMLSQWETGFNRLAGKNMVPPDFMAALMGQYLTAMNMPSRADLAAVNERLHKIENHLAHLTEQMASGPRAPRKGTTAARAGRGPHPASPNGPTSAVAHVAVPAAPTRRGTPQRGARKKKS
jgi:hypothetical protein